MSRNGGNLKHDMMERLDNMRCFGESKHEAKQEARKEYLAEHGNLEGWNPGSVPGKIFAMNTHDTYKDGAAVFADYAKENGINKYRQVDSELCKSFLRHEVEIGKSTWTVSVEMSALNKIFDFGLTKKNCDLPDRQLKDITRSRGGLEELKAERKGTLEENQDQITMTRGTGMRRESMTEITPGRFSYGEDGLVNRVFLIEKGGKERTAPILPQYREAITQIVERAKPEEKIFDEYDHHINNHFLRGEYAKELASELSKSKDLNLMGLDCSYLVNLKGKDLERKSGKAYGLDLEVAAAVSGALGHNRISVLAHYLYRK